MVPELVQYGFVPAGRWVLYPRVKSGITFELDRYADRCVLYAFVVGNEIKYIGICERDTTTLADRMKRYKSRAGGGRNAPSRGSTNRRNADKIRRHLEDGDVVLIYALLPDSGYPFHDLGIDLVKGLENPLIARFQPEWNR